MKTNHWVKPFLFTLLIIVAPFIFYYLYFVEARESFLLDRFHAHLANMAARTEDRFASAVSVVKLNPSPENVLGVSRFDGCDSRDTDTQVSVSREGRNEVRFTKGGCSAHADAGVLVGEVDPAGQFYDVVILDHENKVVFQLGAENGRIDDGQLLARPGGDGDSGTIKDPLVDMRVIYQGRPFLVFYQPLIVSASAADSHPPREEPSLQARTELAPSDVGSWKIVGLLEQSQFNDLKYAVRPGSIVLLVLVILALLLAAPFLKLWYLGRFEPLTRFDIFLQAGAGLCLVAMITVTLLAWHTHSRLSAYFDRQLKSVVDNSVANIEDEFARAVDTLTKLEPPMIEAYQRRLNAVDPMFGEGDCPSIAKTYDEAPEMFDPHGGPTLAGNMLMRSVTADGYRDLSRSFGQLVMSYSMDQRGCQLVKWSSEIRPPDPGQFADRPYFRRALPDERVAPELYGADSKYFHEVIVSRTTGERRIVFSRPVGDLGSPERKACVEAIRNGDAQTTDPRSRVPCVSVISLELRSLQSVLPYGYGVMLLDAASNIVLRSDGDVSTEHNLANEIDDPRRLRTIVRLAVDGETATAATFDAEYGGEPRRFQVVPLGVGELALVGFYDRNLVTTPVLDSVAASVLAWLVWISILAAVFILLWIADDVTERAVRRWPTNFFLFLTGLVALAWLMRVVPPVLLLAGIGIPLSLVPLRFLTREDRYRMNGPLLRAIVVAAIFASAMLAAALPMLVFYNGAEREALGALGRFQMHEYQRAEDLQARVFADWKHKVGLGADDDFAPFRVWKDQKPLVELSGNTQDILECGSGIICNILRKLPQYTDGVVGVHEMYRSGLLEPEGLDGVRRELLNPVPDGHALNFAFAVFVLAALIPIAVWYLLVRTFGLRAENVVEVSSFTMPATDEQVRYMLYGVPAQQKASQYFDPLPSDGKLWLDLRDAPAGTNIHVTDSTDAIAFDHFDANLNDIEVVRQRVDLLEKLLREKRRIILLFVNTDPLNFVTSMHSTDEETSLMARLATVLSRFKLTYHHSGRRREHTDKSGRSSLLSVVRGYLKRPLHTPNWRQKLVEAECRHPDLWEIRDDLLKEPELEKWSKNQIVQQVQSRANAIYQHMWHQCTRVEKFTLIELARGNPVNPNNWDAARRLRLRGHVRTDPFYRIATESLRQFVDRMRHIEDVESWRAESPGAWSHIKLPLIILAIGVLVFVAVSQPDVFNSFYALLAAGAAGFPFLLSALNARLQRSGK